ncbi:hydrogen peroxide-dependent heme synthase [Mobilicoccus pelagius]|uniref:Coproheme decarboxylase n=1 Tax=Mobilicoccus pelagius NBRC 104925 TaxID=1089455 RepID=H5UUK1_9MICO|nr:hydrogen peroxide-dependent heme synthase [Mobilicoccus pelagius]GAB49409.1 putative heme-binding protein [Mobilicoccus pelagius NBRC 104925]
MTDVQTNAAKIRALNETIRYAMWSVFRVSDPLPVDEADRDRMVADLEAFCETLPETGVTLRGLYDIAGFRADAEIMVWWHAEDPEALQAAYKVFRRTQVGRHLTPVWSQMALHRQAEFNKGHVPAFMKEERVRDYVCVYPFVRSYDWYVLPEEERREMLAEHGRMARPYAEVRANTIPSFALGDYEWILAFESDDLPQMVDMMRELRRSRARLHVREETPFYTGPRVDAATLVHGLP